MAQLVMTNLKIPTVMRLCTAIVLLATALVNHAETLRDPTMPADTTIGALGAEIGGDSAGPVLQSIMRGQTVNAALISGEMVQLGQSYHGAKLIKIEESAVVLREADGSSQTLKMTYPFTRKWVTESSRTKPNVVNGALMTGVPKNEPQKIK